MVSITSIILEFTVPQAVAYDSLYLTICRRFPLGGVASTVCLAPRLALRVSCCCAPQHCIWCRLCCSIILCPSLTLELSVRTNFCSMLVAMSAWCSSLHGVLSLQLLDGNCSDGFHCTIKHCPAECHLQVDSSQGLIADGIQKALCDALRGNSQAAKQLRRAVSSNCQRFSRPSNG